MLIGTFSPKDIVLSINDYQIKDFTDGTFIEVLQNSPSYRAVKGIRGKHTRVHQRDNSGTLKFRMMQTSHQNNVLSEIALDDKINQTGLLLVTLRDVGGDTGIQFTNAYLEGFPNVSYQSTSTSPIEWNINYEHITTYYVGGNKKSVFDFI